MLHVLTLCFFIAWAYNIASSWGAPNTTPLKSRATIEREARQRASNAAWVKTYTVILGPPLLIWLLVQFGVLPH